MPPVTEIGLLALIPTKSLNTKSIAKFGANGHAIVKTVNKKKVKIMMIFLPYTSDSGPNSKGPRTYPTRYIEIVRICWSLLVIWKYALMIGIAFEGREEPIVLFTTTTIQTKTIKTFFFCNYVD